MEKRQVRHIIKTHYSKIEKELNKIVVNFDNKALHDFRVAYKKLRAFIRRLSLQSNGGDKIKISKPIKQCYQLSGLLRDFTIQQKNILEDAKQYHNKPNQYLKLLKPVTEDAKKQLRKIIKEKPVNQNKQRTLKQITSGLSSKKLKQYGIAKWSEASNIIAARHFTDTRLHDTRKILKDLFYNLNEDTGDKSPAGKMKYVYFNNLLDELGNYQDKGAGLRLLNGPMINQLDAANKITMNKIKMKWKKEKAAMKTQLVKKLKTTLKEVALY